MLVQRNYINVYSLFACFTLLSILSCQKPANAPKCSINGIDTGASFVQGAELFIRVDATDPDGDIRGVSLSIDGEPVRVYSAGPILYAWDTRKAEPGSHRLEAEAWDRTGMVGNDKMTITLIEDSLLNGPPLVGFNAHHNKLIEGSPVHFFDLSKNGPLSWKWDFGDGETSNLKNPVHVYTSAGSYEVRLTVGNSNGKRTLARKEFISIVEKTDSTVVDFDGNVYESVIIGNQEWMKENLKATHTVSGCPLDDGSEAGNLDYDTLSRYYFSYENQDSNISAYGRLYTWQAVMYGNPSTNSNPSGVQGICPQGWHVPSDAEWMELELFLGMSMEDVLLNKVRGDNEGGMLKAVGTSHWMDPNTGATDDYGFSAMPGGERFWSGVYRDKGRRGSYWSTTKFQHNAAWQRWIYHDHGKICRFDFNRISVGASVRCLRD